MKHLIKFLPVLIILIIASCDIAEVNHNNLYFVSDTIEGTSGGDSSVAELRKIIIFDFSAHMCNNCPAAHRTAEGLINIYGEQVIPVVIHGGMLATPNAEHPTDFRTEDGNEILMEFGVSTFPNGRVGFYNGNDNLTGHSAWADEVESLSKDTATIKIEIENSYTTSSRNLTTNITFTAVSEINANLKLTVFLIESNIISPQDDIEAEDPYVEDYEHNHVFRDAISDVWGIEVFAGIQEIGAEDSKEFYLTLNEDWDAANCMVVAFIYDNDTKEIINVKEFHLID